MQVSYQDDHMEDAPDGAWQSDGSAVTQTMP